MSNRVNTARLNRAIALAQDYIFSKGLEEGTNTTTIYDRENNIEIDIEVNCEYNGRYDAGTYLIPPSWSGKVTNEPVNVIAWFFDEDYDNPTERDITKYLTAYKYSA